MKLGEMLRYREEEDGEGSTSTGESTETKTPVLDEGKLGEMIRQGLKDGLSELQRGTQNSNTNVRDEPKDAWDEILDPRINKKTSQATLRADAAEDKVDFYTSDYWLKEIDELLPGDSNTEDGIVELNKAKKAVREKLESTFTNLLKQGRGIPRTDIVDFALGQYIKESKGTYTDGIIKKSSLKKQKEVEKARRGVDMSSGNISSFSAEQLHKMPQDKINEEFGSLLF